MKNVQTLLLTAVLGAMLQQFLPWYAIALAGFLAVLIINPSSGRMAFLMGLLGGALLWGGYSAYINWLNEGLMAMRFGVTLGGLTPMMMILVTALLGGLYAGMGSLCGHWTRAYLGS